MRAAALASLTVWIGVAHVLAGRASADGVEVKERLADEDPEAAGLSRESSAGDPSFGPVVVIEAIEVVGNSSTATRLIERALPFSEGDAMRTGDPRLRAARIKVLALGYFRSVETRLRKGSARGRVIFTVEVEERGTIVLNRLFFGTTVYAPWWAGLDLTERNLLGTGVAVGGGFVFAGEGDVSGESSQKAFELRAADPSVLGTTFGVHGAGLYVDASEPFRVRDPSDDQVNDFEAFDYRRVGGRAGLSWDVTPLSSFSFDGRVELLDADLPPSPTRMTGGELVPVDLHLEPGHSRVVTLGLAYDHDTRSDPVLTVHGDHLRLQGEVGSTVLGGSYDYAVALGRYQRWWPLRSVRHVLSVHLTGGAVLGDAPRFDRLHVGDLNRLVSPRALGLVVSTRPSHDLLGTGSDDIAYGEIGGIGEVQYSYRLFRGKRRVYGGDLFVGAGVWALGHLGGLERTDPSLPVDLLFDLGLRLDTEIGIFELSVANALGRVPL